MIHEIRENRRKDLVGERFGNLVVIRRAEDKVYPCGQYVTRWVCKCDCGNETTVNTSSLTTGTTGGDSHNT